MSESNTKDEIRVLVTGFGPFLNIITNPSWEIARKLPASLPSPDGLPVKVIVPNAPIPAAYHKILTQSTTLIEQHNPDFIVHIGLAEDQEYFGIEKSASKEGYHEVPDIDRKVFPRAENKKIFAKAPSSLASTLDLESASVAWQEACVTIRQPVGDGAVKAKAKAKPATKAVDVRLTDDVGTYVCGFIYYVSMTEMQSRTGRRDVVFLHVPKLGSESEVETGIAVATELLRALARYWEQTHRT